jgi:hypothetical protein
MSELDLRKGNLRVQSKSSEGRQLKLCMLCAPAGWGHVVIQMELKSPTSKTCVEFHFEYLMHSLSLRELARPNAHNLARNSRSPQHTESSIPTSFPV